MDTFKLDEKFAPAIPQRNCGNCGYMSMELPQGAVQRAMVCRHSPPAMLGIMSPDGRGMQTMTLFPVVTDKQYCWQHRTEQEIVGEESGTTLVANQLSLPVETPQKCLCKQELHGLNEGMTLRCDLPAGHSGYHRTTEGAIFS